MSALGPPPEDDIPDDATQRQWSTTEHLIAHVVDAVNVLRWTLAQINSEGTIPTPEPLPRPGDPIRVPAQLSGEDLARIRHRNRHGKE